MLLPHCECDEKRRPDRKRQASGSAAQRQLSLAPTADKFADSPRGYYSDQRHDGRVERDRSPNSSRSIDRPARPSPQVGAIR